MIGMGGRLMRAREASLRELLPAFRFAVTKAAWCGQEGLGGMRVLLIEDDDLVRMMLSETLGSDGIEVDGLANAEDALILLGAGQVPDVLVTDIDLGPGLNGFDLAEIARSRHPGVEVILISGTAPQSETRRLCRQERFFQKPFAPADLAAAIRQAAAAAPVPRSMGAPG